MSGGAGTVQATGDPVHPSVPVGAVAVAPTGDHGPPSAAGTAHWYPPEGLLRRGTVVLLTGRGEHSGVYERLGRRLAADAYVVHVLNAGPDRAPGDLAADVDVVAADPAVPLVLAGSDTGALHALAVATRTGGAPAGLILAGTPAGPVSGGWADELDARTACPAHRGRLAADPLFTAGALAAPVPGPLAAAAAAALPALRSVPALILHGAADPVSPLPEARRLAAGLPAATLVTVTDGRHDALNDLQHRSVAALVVQWLERLRRSPDPRPVLTVEGPPVA